MKKRNRRLALAFDRLLSRSLMQQMLILVGIMVLLFTISYTNVVSFLMQVIALQVFSVTL